MKMEGNSERHSSSEGKNSRLSRDERRNVTMANPDLAVEMLQAREMHRSLKNKERLEGKLTRVQRRLEKARRALARKTMKKMRETTEIGSARSGSLLGNGRARMDTARKQYLAENGGLPSWRKPHLEDYTFNSPVVHSLLSHGMSPEHRFITEKNRSAKYTQIGNKDAKELKRLGVVSDGGHHGVVKSDFVNYAEQRIVFDRMMKPAPMRGKRG